MAERYQYYNTNDDGAGRISRENWHGQTFTPAIAHKITSVKLKLYSDWTPGPVTVSIRATDAEGKPTGEDLCSGTIDGNALTHDELGEWYEITLGEGCVLDADKKYAIVVRVPDSGSYDYLFWRYDQTDPTYERGNRVYSATAGKLWTADTSRDFMFEEWGEEIKVAGRSFGYVY